jgi:gamma-glutamylputrescine oxidase
MRQRSASAPPIRRLKATTADVVIIGGGFTGLQAAYHLAAGGKDVVLIEGARFGDGASGRNGGQLGTGQRAWPEEQEADFGRRAKAPSLPWPNGRKRI